MSRIQRAILSVTDKSGLADFARKLAALGVELVSTGGTAKLLRDSGIAVKDISELTGFPEMLDGRVKTLHPKVHGGILYRRADSGHLAAVAEHGIPAIDMVVVNLYAFEKTAAKPGVRFEELIENIDIGGPSMIRSAAKNFQDVAVVTSPADYGPIAEEMARSGGALSRETKWRLAQKAFATTAAYDSAIASTLERVGGDFELRPSGSKSAESKPTLGFPQTLRLSFQKVADLRYGENPHQKAAMYADGSGTGVANARQVQGKELSYNNMVDLASRVGSGAGVRRAGLRHYQTHKSLRRRDRQDAGGGLRAGTRMRSRLGLWRSDRGKPHGGYGRSPRDGQALPRSHCRSRIRGRGESGVRLEEESAAGGSSRRTAQLGFQKSFWRSAGSGFRSSPAGRGRSESR